MENKKKLANVEMKTKKVEISLISIYSTYRRYSRGILARKIDEKENHDIVPLKACKTVKCTFLHYPKVKNPFTPRPHC